MWHNPKHPLWQLMKFYIRAEFLHLKLLVFTLTKTSASKHVKHVFPNKLGIHPGGSHESFRPNTVRVSDSRVKPLLFWCVVNVAILSFAQARKIRQLQNQNTFCLVLKDLLPGIQTEPFDKLKQQYFSSVLYPFVLSPFLRHFTQFSFPSSV